MTVNNSTALQDDDDLTFAIAANETWHVRMPLIVTTNTAADFKLMIDVPAAAAGTVQVVFEVPSEVEPERLDFSPGFAFAKTVKYVFE